MRDRQLRGIFLAALFVLGTAAAQEAVPPAAADAAFDDPFADFDDFDDAFGDEAGGLVWSGFIEAAYGRRRHAAAAFDTAQTLGDLRARVETEWAKEKLVLSFKGDALYDDYLSDFDVDARELSVQVSVSDSVDLKLGRQVLTWGTGDLLFLNDLFPKSWVSFFSGRDDEYLKAPSDAVRMTWYNDRLNVDVVWSPRFQPDEYISGERFSFFSPLAAQIVAPRPPVDAEEPPGESGNGELGLRLFRTIGSTEFAGYAYRGFYKTPLGLTDSLRPTFPRLDVWGGSVRRPLGQGLFNAEFAVHQSSSDRSGTNPFVPNDQLRFLIGYEFEARTRFNVGLQYYVEHLRHYDDLLTFSPAPAFESEQTRHLLTARLTWRSVRERLTASLFTFYSPTDRDHYLRPVISFRHSDQWNFAAGANLFGGERLYTFFGQFEDNSNAWFRARFSY